MLSLFRTRAQCCSSVSSHQQACPCSCAKLSGRGAVHNSALLTQSARIQSQACSSCNSGSCQRRPTCPSAALAPGTPLHCIKRPFRLTQGGLYACPVSPGAARCFAGASVFQTTAAAADGQCGRAARLLANASSPPGGGSASLRVAVVGGGLAGVATAWQLMRHTPRGRPVVLHLYDAAGIAAGGSGAAAGLLHPYNPRGKLLWRGEEAMQAALELVAAAEAATAATTGKAQLASPAGPSHASNASVKGPCAAVSCGLSTIAWRHGLVRPAANAKQAATFARALGRSGAEGAAAEGAEAGAAGSVVTAAANGAEASGAGGQQLLHARVLTAGELQALVPGLLPPKEDEQSAGHSGTGAREEPGGAQPKQNRKARRAAAAAAATASPAGAGTGAGTGGLAACPDNPSSHVAAFLVPQGLVLDVGGYLRALWRACQAEAEARCDGSVAELRINRVDSLERLAGAPDTAEGSRSAYDAIVVAAGAAASTIEEVRETGLPLQLCQGFTLVMGPTPEPDGQERQSYPAGSPSLLGQPYIAAQGPRRVVVGATKAYGWTADAALEACMRSEYARGGTAAGMTIANSEADRAPEPREELEAAAGVSTRAAGTTTAAAAGAAAAGAGVATQGTAGDRDRSGVGTGMASSEELELQEGSGPKEEAEEAALTALRRAACGVWAPLRSWRVERVREGVRALPPRTSHGSLPLLGRLCPGRPWWLVAGLGSRGLVYHGMLGRLAAQALLDDSEAGVPPELTAWRRVSADRAEFDAP